MLSSFQVNPDIFTKSRSFFLTWGIIFIILGSLAIGADVFTTYLTIMFIGITILVGGVIVIFDTFSFWRQTAGGFVMHFLMGALYIAVGTILIQNPIQGSISLTFVLGIFYLVLGAFRTFYAISSRVPYWGWSLFSGIITLLLGALILASWPASGLYIIGLFVGIDLLFCGWVYVMAALSARALSKR